MKSNLSNSVGKQDGNSKLMLFEDSNGFIQVPNAVFDIVMPKLSPRAFRLLCFILRKTKGWNKQTDKISYTQIESGIGTTSWKVIKCAICELLGEDEEGNQVGIRFITRANRADTYDTAEYTLNLNLNLSKKLLVKHNGFVSKKDKWSGRRVEKLNKVNVESTVDNPTVESTVDTHRRIDGSSRRRIDGDNTIILNTEEERKEKFIDSLEVKEDNPDLESINTSSLRTEKDNKPSQARIDAVNNFPFSEDELNIVNIDIEEIKKIRPEMNKFSLLFYSKQNLLNKNYGLPKPAATFEEDENIISSFLSKEKDNIQIEADPELPDISYFFNKDQYPNTLSAIQ